MYVPGVDIGDAAVARAPIPDDTKQTAQYLLPIQRRWCAELGLIASVATLDRIIELFSRPHATYGELHTLGSELRGRLNDEMFGTLFFSLTAPDAYYFTAPTQDGAGY